MKSKFFQFVCASIFLIVFPISAQTDGEANGFVFSNLYFIDNFTYLQVKGEVKNESGKSYGNVYFTLKLYDDKNELLGVSIIFLSHISKGHKKTFESSTDYIDTKLIKKYKIVFDNGE